MEQKCDEERWALVDPPQTSAKSLEYIYGEEDDDDDEALSLSDFPIIHHLSVKHTNEEETQEGFGFDFGFCSLSEGPEMCSADEVFHQGLILPFRPHSITSKKELFSQHFSARSISRTDSMDRYSSAGFTDSSRSSSISSRHSSSSSGSSAATTKLPPRIDFHSHPSPSPRTYCPTNRRGTAGTNRRNRVQKPSPWNIFRLGVVAAPHEIAFQDLKTRGNRWNRNSSSNSSSSLSSEKKNGVKRRGLFSGCRCSTDAVDTVSSKVVIIRRSATEGEVRVGEVATKKGYRRTFEWLKQVSLEG